MKILPSNPVSDALNAAQGILDVSAEVTADTLKKAQTIVLIAELGDVGAPFEDAAIHAFTSVKDTNPAEWQRMRKRLKNAGIGIGALEKAMRGSSVEMDDEGVADRLVAMAKSMCEFVHDEDGEPYAIIEDGASRQVMHIASKAYGELLSYHYYRTCDRAPTELALRTALATLKGAAKFDGEQRAIHIRIALHDGAYWLDLCDDAWRAVRIDAHGWRVFVGKEVPLFTRSASMRPLPTPTPNGNIEDLWQLVNIPSESRLIVLAWLLECLRPDTAYPLLELIGEQGTAKSSSQNLLRELIDPNQANLRAAPKSAEDLWIQARNALLVSLENISHLSAAYQDALCVLATGGGYSSRTLYTNADETILSLKRPVVLNGISVVVTAQDLLDRSLHVDLPTITARVTGGDLQDRFAKVHGRLLGALLDLFVRVLAQLPKVSIDPTELPRMADFAMLGEALFQVSGRPAGTFLATYRDMRSEGVSRTIDSSPVGAAILAFLARNETGFEGTVQDLLARLEMHKPGGESWPRSAKGLADALRRLAPGLRQIGINARIGERSKHGYRVTLMSSPDAAQTGKVHHVHHVHPVSTAKGALGEHGARGLTGGVRENNASHTGNEVQL